MKVYNGIIIGAVVLAAATVLVLKQIKPTAIPTRTITAHTQALPRLVDLGAGKCIPCKAMKPILDELKAKYSTAFITEFVDVWENKDAKARYKINLIPTQIFYGAEGQELFRHEGFLSKEDILATWRELGVHVNE